MTPFLGNISSNSIFPEIFVKYVSNSFFAWKIYQNLSYSHRLTPILLVFSLNDPLFRRKISHRKTPSFELLSEHPVTSKVECPIRCICLHLLWYVGKRRPISILWYQVHIGLYGHLLFKFTGGCYYKRWLDKMRLSPNLSHWF